ncbi:MAG: SurA N-terminal domain-containing protein [Balneolales bacterium]
MEKLRGGTKYTIWILIISFGLLWVLADTQVFDAVMVGPSAMGEVQGDPISYEEFNERLNMYTEQYRERSGEAPSMEMRAMYEEQVWDELVLNKVLQQKMNELGLTVTDDELMQMVTGDNPAPFIRQQFQTEDGTIDRAALRNAIEAPENADIWMMVEQQLREGRRQEKLNNFLESSLVASDSEIEREFIRENTRADFRYVRFPYSEVDDSQIEVTDSEAQSYYQNNQDRFMRNESWSISYVQFPKVASAEDTTRIMNNLAGLQDDFQETDDEEQFLQTYNSQTNYFDDFLTPSEVRNEHLDAFNLNIGEVSEPYIYRNQAHMLKMLEKQSAGQTYTRARQIQINFTEQNRDEVQERGEAIAEEAREGAPFQQLAQMHSQDNASSSIGGEIGYFGQQDKPAPLANAAFQASPGSIIGPIEADGSFYIMEIIDRTDQEIRFADLSRFIEPDPLATIEALAREADDFAYYADEGDFESEAESSGLTVNQAVATENNPFISGLGESRLILAELQTMDRNEISEVIETDDWFVVLRINQRSPAGERPLSEVRDQVNSAVRNQKRKQILVDQVNESLNQHPTIEDLAEAEEREIREVEDIAKSAARLPGVGREPRVIGAAFGLAPSEQTKAIQGENAVYVVHVDERREPNMEELTSEERESIRVSLNQLRSQEFGQIWTDRVQQGVEVSDYRYLRDVRQQ